MMMEFNAAENNYISYTTKMPQYSSEKNYNRTKTIKEN